jgi:hypothetical protein
MCLESEREIPMIFGKLFRVLTGSEKILHNVRSSAVFLTDGSSPSYVLIARDIRCASHHRHIELMRN